MHVPLTVSVSPHDEDEPVGTPLSVTPRTEICVSTPKWEDVPGDPFVEAQIAFADNRIAGD